MSRVLNEYFHTVYGDLIHWREDMINNKDHKNTVLGGYVKIHGLLNKGIELATKNGTKQEDK